MMTVSEVSRLTGVSVRTLRYYDRIGLLPPTDCSQAGYRLYDDAALELLQQILLFRELEFPLNEIADILKTPDFDRRKAIGQQIELLTMKREHIDDLIALARRMEHTEVRCLDFKAFDTRKMDEYARQAKASWGRTEAYREFENKSKNRTKTQEKDLGDRLMAIIAEFGALKDRSPADAEVQKQVKFLQSFISEHYYNCTKEILSGLGKMYADGGSFTENINAAGGPGTAEFAGEAIRYFCEND